MVTIHRAQGLRFAIYPNDHEPAHVHVYGDGEIKVNIADAAGLPELVYAIGMKRADLRKAMDEVKDNQGWFLAEWNRPHGEGL
jgi:hypothetical protein